MVALIPTNPPCTPADRALVLELLQDPALSLEAVAHALNWTLDHLTLFLTSQAGLALLAECELALAVRTRLAAAAQLHAAVTALGLMLSEYAATATKTPFDERKIATHELREVQRTNARRAAHLLFRLAHFTPKPIRSYAPAPATQTVPSKSCSDDFDVPPTPPTPPPVPSKSCPDDFDAPPTPPTPPPASSQSCPDDFDAPPTPLPASSKSCPDDFDAPISQSTHQPTHLAPTPSPTSSAPP